MGSSPVDLHLHSVFSDGSLTPGQLAERASAAGLKAVCLTDHDTAEGFPSMREACLKAGLETMSGIELSCTYRQRSIHILGYGMDTKSPSFKKQLSSWQRERDQRYDAITEKLRRRGYPVSTELLHRHFPGAVLTRAHIAVYMAEQGMAPDKETVFKTLIGRGCPCYVERKPVEPGEAVSFLLSHGGVPVFAHPILTRMSAEELDEFTGSLARLGLMGIEGYYSGYGRAQEQLVASLAEKYGLFLTGGSDFHGTAKPSISVGTGKGGLYVPYSCYQSLKEAVRSLQVQPAPEEPV